MTALGVNHLATTTPAERLGRTMVTAGLGRGIDDTGGLLLLGAVAAVAGLSFRFAALGGMEVIIAAVSEILQRAPEWGLPSSKPHSS